MVIMMVDNKDYVGGKCGPDGDNDGWPDKQLDCKQTNCARDNCRKQYVLTF